MENTKIIRSQVQNDSFEDNGNKTVNLSQAFGCESMAQGDFRLSMGYPSPQQYSSQQWRAKACSKMISTTKKWYGQNSCFY
jgi:hypothetical protein